MKWSIEARDKAKAFGVKDLRKQIVNVMRNHIGEKNAITQRELFTQVWGDPSGIPEIEVFFMWEKLKKELHYLRKNTYCFVANRRTNNNIYFFIVKSKDDANHYIQDQIRIVENSLKMMKQAEKAVEEKWHRKLSGDISLPGKNTKLLV